MLKFTNGTTKENFLNTIQWSGNQVEHIEAYGKNQQAWQISDKFGNVWNVLFDGNNEYSISNVCKCASDIPLNVIVLFNGNEIEIHSAEKEGRKIKAERLLKQFSQLAMMVNCYKQFGYLV